MSDLQDDVCFRLSTRLLTATIDPRHGARILSLKATESGREWLVPPPDSADRSAYGSRFTDRAIHGWDEMFPTIDACTVNRRQIPDHGEVWAVPWSLTEPRHPDGIRLQVESRTMPLTLSREASGSGDDIDLYYELSNMGTKSLPVQWTPHPQFALTSSTQIKFSPTPTSARITSPLRGTDHIAWQQVEHQSEVVPVGSHLKAWIEEPFALRSVTLVEAEDSLTMCWRSAVLPYAAVLWDNGEFSQQRTLTVEPAMNASESLARSQSLHQATHIRAGETLKWHILLSASSPDFRHTPNEAEPVR